MKKFYLIVLSALLATTSAYAQINFVCIGNSITHGNTAKGVYHSTSIVDSLTEMSYRFWFWEKVDSMGVNAQMVGFQTKYFNQSGTAPVSKSRYTGHTFTNNHEGYYGIRTDGFLNGGSNPNFDTRLLGYMPHVALIHLGHNDPDSTDALAAIIETNLRSIITKLRNRNPNVTILLASQIASWKTKLNARIPGICTSMSTANSIVYFVNMPTGFISDPAKSGTMTLDWVHPNARGQKHMAGRFFEAYKKITQADAVAPSIPSAITVSNIKNTSVDLAWTASTDNIGVNTYAIYANDSLIGYTGNLTYTATGLKSNTDYTFKVSAVDYKKNESAKSSGTLGSTIGIVMQFTVSDGTKPLQDVNVTFGTFTGKTNASGVVIFSNNVVGISNYTISKTGWKTQTGTINLTANNTKLITLAPNCLVTIYVKDGTTPIADAEVTFDGVKKSSDAQGRVLFTDLKVGVAYIYSVYKAGYTNKNSNVVLKGDSIINIALTTGSALAEESEKILIFPIPANDYITINNAEGATIEFNDMLGRKVMSMALKSNAEIIDASGLNEGYYVIRIVAKDGSYKIKKILILK